jgi:hypothetical protein
MNTLTDLVTYMEGLQPLADDLAKILAGSKLNITELAALAHIHGYLSAAKYKIQKEF